MKPGILLIDHLDSFSFNLAESFERLGRRVQVMRSHVEASRAFDIAIRSEALIVLSPGPGRPADAGCYLELIGLARGYLPLLGICLGHQAIVEEAGGAVRAAPAIVHGKASVLHHDGKGPFQGLESPLRVGRYHSLCTPDVPSRFQVHAGLEGMAMAISDVDAMQFGIQFHPESILTPLGDRILANILASAQR
ncbi:anthranilate synthase component II [Allosphingosinicella sp.]|uniref:anthranilate synthase component II n=1 Tax=Allosphingosinicella sp. TaxID=2823234 RepID=UPI002FC1E122